MSDLTQLLSAIEAGDPLAAERLLPLVYRELHGLAARELSAERAGHTLSATALVHEAWLRMAGSDGRNLPSRSRQHFFGAAARAMRQVLIDHARRKQADKRGAGRRAVPLEENHAAAPERSAELLALDEALTRLERDRPELARLVELRYFVGFSMVEAAESLEVPLRTAERNWTYAKAWLRRELSDGEAPKPRPVEGPGERSPDP